MRVDSMTIIKAKCLNTALKKTKQDNTIYNWNGLLFKNAGGKPFLI